MRHRKALDATERVRKDHFVDEVKENKCTCYVCGADLWDDKRQRLKHKATYRFRGRKTGDLMFACNECKTLVAIIRANDMN